jgi:hypothetical protein
MKRIIATIVGSIIVIALSVGVSLATASTKYRDCPGAGEGNAVVVMHMSCKTAGYVLYAAGTHLENHPRSRVFHVTTRGRRYYCEVKIKSSHSASVGCATTTSAMGAYIRF